LPTTGAVDVISNAFNLGGANPASDPLPVAGDFLEPPEERRAALELAEPIEAAEASPLRRSYCVVESREIQEQ
jgi:hypothetical protein